MYKHKTSRKERRKAEQNKLANEQLRKGTTVLSSAIVVSSIAAPIAAPKIAEASEDQTQSAQISFSDTEVPTHTQAEPKQATTADTNDSMTQETQTTTAESETTSSENTSETQGSSELNTSETTQSTEVPETTETTTDSTTSEKEEVKTPDLSMRSALDSFSMRSRSISPSAFIAEIAEHARTAAAENDLYASVMIAQAILESDWGRSMLAASPNHNLFGIKGSYQGQSVYMKTWEVINGQNVMVTAAFRKYPSHLESFYDNAYVLKNTSFQAGVYFYSGTWKSNTNSYRDATAWLTGRYATDPNYGPKLNNIIATYGLTQYDTPSSGGGSTGGNTGGGNTGGNTGANTGGGTNAQDVIHTVKAGDSLWALASKYGTSIANIKSWNNLSSDMIYVGQKLIVGKGSGNTGGNTGGGTGGNTGGSTGNTGGSNNTGTTDSYYTVKAGDSLWAIANANGVSIANLRQWNNLSGDIIYPGQRLIVKKGGGTSSGNTGGNTGGSTGNTGGSNNNGAASTYYTVKAGDSLWAIANANGVSIANLRQWNNLNGDIIYPGQRLIVKKGGNAGSGNAGSTNNGSTGSTGGSNNSGAATGYYTVKAGDSLWAIASAHGTSVANLRQWNSLSGDIIYPGQRLIVKKGQGGSTGSNASSNNQGNSQTNGSHKVKSGDTLWGLAQKYGTSIQQIKQWNGLSGDIIYVGQSLKVK
ncbi:LysM peptidoglycan-binding domain-containing protein [Candidatus Enterococcus mansonii]|uniref:Peptidoglycan hydrolase n=1 Tax=Candidatus Enterococcus mansonii TaxID=1834181 RepID=A0A242CGM5_9ENTE|nr:LysM peptidoglycan-binding domain-containing protein [Enterococcus sp. 4G2_DIV0659]OTO09366.1 hypothetical protein A5880_000045 [Enterococcus sp. 4G2_DIV0659]